MEGRREKERKRLAKSEGVNEKKLNEEKRDKD